MPKLHAVIRVSIGALAALCATPVFANAVLALGAAGDFGVIAGPGVAFQTNNGDIDGTVGIESNATFSASGPGTISGVDFQSAITSQNNSVSNTTITNGEIENTSLLMSAATSIGQLSTWANELTGGTTENLGDVTSSVTLTAASSGITVFNATNVNIQNGGQITINGGTNSIVVINVSGDFNTQANNASGSIVLTGGITDDQVLWNITSTGNNFSSSGNYQTNIIQGDFLDLGGNMNINEVTVDGRIFGGDSDGTTRSGVNSMQIVSNFAVNAPPNVSTPEPATWLLSLCVVGIIGIQEFRRSRQLVSKSA